MTRIPSRSVFSKKFVAVKPPFQADGVHAHIAHVCQIRVQPSPTTSGKRRSGAPSRSTDQQFFFR